MNKGRLLLTLLLALGFAGAANAQVAMTGVNIKGIEQLFTIPKTYTAVRVSDSIKLDGKLDEKTWANAPWTDSFVDIEGAAKPSPRYKTHVKMAWDDEYIYFAAEVEDPHIWANLKEHDQIVFYDNDFEIFMDPDGDTHNYYEYETNALGTIFDLFIVKTYRAGGPPILNWNFEGLKQAINIDGTINNPSDTDRKWTVEVAIPFKSMAFEFKTPSLQKPWRVNFSRVEWDTKVENGKYVKEVDPSTGKNKPENNWVWSPQGVINMHCPERWGYLSFSNSTSLEGVKPFVVPQEEQAKSALWALFYRQEEYAGKNGLYAKDMKDLGFKKDITVNNVPYTLLLETTTDTYEATLLDKSGKAVAKIFSDGKIY
jgi:Domain of unknown function (DUF1083).